MRRVLVISFNVLLIFAVLHPVESQSNAVCGDILEGEISVQEADTGHVYNFEANAGDEINVTASPIGQTPDIEMYIYDPGGSSLGRYSGDAGDVVAISNFVMPATGRYQLQIRDDNRRPMAYVIAIGCILRSGTTIEPGDTIEPSLTPTQASLSTTASGFLFPELPQNGIELPLVSGQAQTIPVGSDILLYTYDVANTDQSATLSISRVSGDISLGITVMNRDTSEILFLGGMPSSNNLSVELTFPTSGTYAIGFFRLDTAERSGTSGAVQLVIE